MALRDPQPLVRLWLLRRINGLRQQLRPRDAPHVHSTGPEPVRVLLAGDGLPVGYGVLSHQLGFGGALARRLTASTGRGFLVDIIAEPVMSPNALTERLAALSLSSYDLVIVNIGVSDALGPIRENAWRDEVANLFGLLDAVPAATFVLTIPRSGFTRERSSLLWRYVSTRVDDFNEVLSDEAAGLDGLRVVTVEPLDDRAFADQPTRATYERWAAQLAPSFAPAVMRSRALRPGDEDARQQALDRLAILDSTPEESFTRIARTARAMFGTSAAAITFIDHDRQWTKAVSGMEGGSSPRDTAFCDVTIQKDAVFVIEDAANDDRFKNYPSVAGDAHVRFYAGYPIETAEGERVGALCVIDTEPREFTRSDAAILRDLALQAQGQLAHRALNAEDFT